jgi:hypothetical protein
MTYRSRVARVTALTIGALALTGGVAGASAGHAGSPVAHGTVTAVGGVTTAGTCGTAGASGEFTVTSSNNATPPVLTSVNVDVTPSTSFVNHKATPPTFANVCVGDTAIAIGANTGGVVTASAVQIKAPPTVKPEHDFGKVTEVNGNVDTGSCGIAGTSGEFTLDVTNGGTTVVKRVDVTPSTQYYEPKVTGATFADVCVGYSALAIGPNTTGTVAAGLVAIHVPKPPKPLHVAGAVTAVDGNTASGTCGTPATAGAFSVTYTDDNTVPASLVTRTVNVTASTPVFDKVVASATFADVCVGDKAAVIGTDTTGDIDALAVAVTPPKAPRA